MTPIGRDAREQPEHDLYDDTPRSIFAATWFRVILVLIVLGVIGAVAVPYILDLVNPPSTKSTIARPPMPPAAPAPTTPQPAPPPPVDKEAEPPKKDATPPAPASVPSMPAKRAPDKTQTVAKVQTVPPVAAARPTDTKPATTRQTTTATKRAVAHVTADQPATGGTWWVQVGAFKNEATAKRLVAKLREQRYAVDETVYMPSSAAAPKSTTAATAVASRDQYDVIVSGLPAEEIDKRLGAKGLASQTVNGNILVKPSLPLRDAVALSKDLAAEGLKVQVKRAGSGDARSATPALTSSPTTLYRVRVGGFADRAAAQATAKELEAKGYQAFVGRG